MGTTFGPLKTALTRPLATRLSLWNIAILLFILAAAIDLRVESVLLTKGVFMPPGADAQDYFFYAYNLKEYDTYSRQPTIPKKSASAPTPDAVRSPGYPLFLYPFIKKPPSYEMIKSILMTQALLSAATVLLAYFLFFTFLSPSGALVPAFLTAISPHLITMNIYVLSETLFCFLCVFGFWLIARIPSRNGAGIPLLTGIIFAAASLTRPGLQYFIVPLAMLVFYHFGKDGGWKKAGFLALGFALGYAPWIARNLLTLGITTDHTLMIGTLENGIYPDFMYHGNLNTFGYPYLFDPKAAELSKSVGTVLTAIWQHLLHEPKRYLGWYLVGKPIMLWSWNTVTSMGDVFVYRVFSSPYWYLPQFELTHALMYALHWPLVVLGLIGCVLVWLPARIVRLPGPALFVSRATSLQLFYWTLLLMVGAPFPRYSIPLRPFLFGMAALGAVLMVRWMRSRLWPAPPVPAP